MNPTYLSALVAPRRQSSSIDTHRRSLMPTTYPSYEDAPDPPQGLAAEAAEVQAYLTAARKTTAPRRVFGELRTNGDAISGRIQPTQQNETGRRTSLARPSGRRPVSAILAERLAIEAPQSLSDPAPPDDTDQLLRREARRRTIYVPDDTTVMTIHPGSFDSAALSYGSSVPGSSLTQRAARRGSLLHQEAARRGRPQSTEPEQTQTLVLPSMDVPPPAQADFRAKVRAHRSSILVHSSRASSNLDEDVSSDLREASILVSKKPRRPSLAMPAKRMGAAKMSKELPLATVKEDDSPMASKAQQRSVVKSGAPVVKGGAPGRAVSTRPALSNVTNKRASVVKSRRDIKSRSEPFHLSKPSRHPDNIHALRKGDCGGPSAPMSIKVDERGRASERQPLHSTASINLESVSSSKSISALNSIPAAKPNLSWKAKSASNSTSASKSISQARFKSSNQSHNPTMVRFDVVKDPIPYPELYEQNWLQHQEVALTQLLNSFFEEHDPNAAVTIKPDLLRSILIQLYHTEEFVNLNSRIEASLRYGSLALPKHVLDQNPTMMKDIGNYHGFLNIFLEAYELHVLQAGIEAIIGREIVETPPELEGPFNEVAAKSAVRSRKAITLALDMYFVMHDDVPAPTMESDNPLWAPKVAAAVREGDIGVNSDIWKWRRTVIRSLMLILVLDRAASARIIQGCVFQPSSPYRSSESVVKALARTLLPSSGDIMRTLKYVDYAVSYVQSPLDGFDYQIQNLAVDMRDGIRLGHLVQLLLQKASGEGQPVATLTESLKYPAQTSAHKLNNCSVALSEIQRLPNLPVDFIIHTKAIDIVNGHRERTIGILWLLLVHYGMSSLVDWCQLQSEVVRCQSKLKTGEHPRSLFVDSDLEASSCRTYWHKLLEWASACAQLQGVEVSNLTSSFAGPAAFDAIINTYYPLFPTHFQSFVELQLPGTRGTASMKLRAIGCSGPFVELMCQNQSSSIPTADFTLTCLVFLAGRLLPAAKFNAAACIIQQKYRKHLGYQRSLKRIALVRLAQACSAVISAQQQVKEEEERQRKAAVVLQRTWRRILNSTCEQFHGDIKKLQTMARGFVVRRREAIVTWRRTRPSYVARREEEAALQAAHNRYQDERHQRLRYFQTHELDGPEGEERREARAVARWTLEAYRTEEA